MTGKRYFLSSSAAWYRHATRCVEAHYIVLDNENECGNDGGNTTRPSGKFDTLPLHTSSAGDLATVSKMIFVLVTADEAAHIAFENDPDVEPLPHPLSRAPIPERAAAALARFGVMQGDDMFTAAEKLARIHPLLKHRVF